MPRVHYAVLIGKITSSDELDWRLQTQLFVSHWTHAKILLEMKQNIFNETTKSNISKEYSFQYIIL